MGYMLDPANVPGTGNRSGGGIVDIIWERDSYSVIIMCQSAEDFL